MHVFIFELEPLYNQILTDSNCLITLEFVDVLWTLFGWRSAWLLIAIFGIGWVLFCPFRQGVLPWLSADGGWWYWWCWYGGRWLKSFVIETTNCLLHAWLPNTCFACFSQAAFCAEFPFFSLPIILNYVLILHGYLGVGAFPIMNIRHICNQGFCGGF